MGRGRPPLALDTWGTIRKFHHRGAVPTAEVRYRDSDGVVRKISRAGRTMAEAQRNLIDAIRERLTPTEEAITRETRLRILSERWMEEVRRDGKATGTIARYESTVRNHLAPLGELRLREFSPPRMQRLVNSVADASGPSAAKLVLVVLNGVCGLAVRNGALLENPVPSLRSPVVKRAVVRAPSLDQVHLLRALLAAYDDRPVTRGAPAQRDLADIGDILIATGARIGEVLALRWSDIDLDARTLTISATIVREAGRGAVIQEHPKSESSIRRLYLPSFALDVLARRRAAAYNELVFPSMSGTPRWPENVRTQWTKALTGTELSWMTTRSCRKAVANHLEASADLEAAMEQLGHSSPKITATYYVETRIDRPDNSALLDQLRGPAERKNAE